MSDDSVTPIETFLAEQADPQLVPERFVQAVRSGDLKVARALLLAHHKVEARPERKRAQAELLRELRYWVRPSKPPTMQTINGIGTTLYGKYQRGDDGLHVATLWFTFVFIPVFPLAAYLVSPAEKSGWYFLGKVPLPPAARATRWIVLAAALLAMLGGAAAAWNTQRHASVYAYNGFDVPISVRVGARAQEVPSHGSVSFDLPIGPEPATFSATLGDLLLEELPVPLDDLGGETLIYNVGARGVLSVGYIRYGEGEPSEGYLLDMGPVIALDQDIDYVFATPPEQKSVREGGSVENTVLQGFDATATAADLAMFLLNEGRPAHALALIGAELRRGDELRGFVPFLVQRVARDAPELARAWLAPVLAAHDADLDLHRAWQELHGADEQAALVQSYRTRFDAAPDSAAAAYLLARLLDPRQDETMTLLARAVALDPSFAVAFGALGWNHGIRGEHLASLAAYQRQAELDPEAAGAADERVRAATLAGLPEPEIDALARASDGAMTWASAHLEATRPGRLDPLMISLAEGEEEQSATFLASVLLSGGRLDAARERLATVEPSKLDASTIIVPLRLAQSSGAADADVERARAALAAADAGMLPDFVLVAALAFAERHGLPEGAAALAAALSMSELEVMVPFVRAAPGSLDHEAAASAIAGLGLRSQAAAAAALAYRVGGADAADASAARWRKHAQRFGLPDEVPVWR